MRTALRPGTANLGRRAAWAFTGLVALLLLALALACLVYPPRYVLRVIAWGDADADDYLRFPARAVLPLAGAQPLPRRIDAAVVEAAWRQAGGDGDLASGLGKLGTQAFLVLRGGAVIYEGYFNGTRPDQWVTSFSVAKSVLSVLVGIAVAEGAIHSLDDPVTRYLPELRARDARFEQITLRHLLNMSSGIRYAEFPFFHGDDAKTYYYPDLRALALHETQVESEPGRRFHYNNYHPLLLGMVLERSTRMPVAAYLESKLWQPAGMSGAASWSLDSERSGFEKLESGINARAEDFARFGQLMLEGGRAAGRQVVAAGWVQASTAPDGAQIPAGYYAGSPWLRSDPARFYQAFWWGHRRADGGHDFAARGNHGQLVYVSRANDVVIVRHGTRYGMDAGRWYALAAAMADALGSAPPAPPAEAAPAPPLVAAPAPAGR